MAGLLWMAMCAFTCYVYDSVSLQHRLLNRCDMDRDGVLDSPRVAAGEHDHQRNSGGAHGLDHHSIALAQSRFRDTQSAELIVLVRVGAGEIERALGMMRHYVRQRSLELAQ